MLQITLVYIKCNVYFLLKLITLVYDTVRRYYDLLRFHRSADN